MASIDRLRLETFETRMVDLATVDPSALLALSVSVSWPHREADWRFILGLGEGLALVDEIGRALGSVMWFRTGDDFAMFGMMMTSPRLQAHGAGRALMLEAMRRNPLPNLGLTSTRQSRRLHRELGFGFEQRVTQRQGEARAPFVALATDLRRDFSDLDALDALDRAAQGHDRRAILAALLGVSETTVLLEDGRPAAFALSRPFGRGHVVGPVIAANDAQAIAVVAPHVAAHAGTFLRIDTPMTEGAFADFLEESGLPVYDNVTSMGLHAPSHAPVSADGPRRYGLVSQTLG